VLGRWVGDHFSTWSGVHRPSGLRGSGRGLIPVAFSTSLAAEFSLMALAGRGPARLPPRLPGRPGVGPIAVTVAKHRACGGNPAPLSHPVGGQGFNLCWARMCAPCRNNAEGPGPRAGWRWLPSAAPMPGTLGGCAAHPARHRPAGALVPPTAQPLLLRLRRLVLGCGKRAPLSKVELEGDDPGALPADRSMVSSEGVSPWRLRHGDQHHTAMPPPSALVRYLRLELGPSGQCPGSGREAGPAGASALAGHFSGVSRLTAWRQLDRVLALQDNQD